MLDFWNVESYSLTEENVEITDNYIVIPTTFVMKAIGRGAHQFDLWLTGIDKTIYISVSTVSNYTNQDLGRYFVPIGLWVSP